MSWSLPLSMLLCTIMVTVTVTVHYEALRLITDQLLPRLRLPPRQQMIFVIFGVFLAHTIEVWLFGLVYSLSKLTVLLGGFRGNFNNDTLDFTYFSALTYTSLGLGDVYPYGGMRLLTGVEALVGLLMIGWSASYTYLAMQRFWDMHRATTATSTTPSRRTHKRHRASV